MEITLAPLEWTSDDVLTLQTFLTSKTGARLLPKVVEQTAPLLEVGDTNSILIRSGKVLGVQDAIRIILALASPEPPAPTQDSTEYPDPTDDSQWPGPKINPKE